MCLDCHLCFPVVFTPQQNPTTGEGLPQGKHTMPKHRFSYPDIRCKRRTCHCTLYFLRSTRRAHMYKPLINLLHKQPLRSRKCGNQPYHLQDLAKSGLTSLPAGKIMPKQQNSKAMTWSYNSLNGARNFEKTTRGTQAAHLPTNPWTR